MNDLTYGDSSGSGWESWVQNIGGSLIKTVAQAKYSAPVELQKMQMQAYGPYGQPYYEGQPNRNEGGALGLGIPTSWILIGGVVLAVVLLKN